MSKVLEIFLRNFGPYWYESITQLLKICRLLIHSLDWRRWRWFDYSELSFSRNQFEMIWALWCGVLSCWKHPSVDGYTVVINRSTWSATILSQAVVFKAAGTQRLKMCQENSLKCCCSPSASTLNVMCYQRCSSVYFGCNEWLFEWLLLPITSKQSGLCTQTSTRHFHSENCCSPDIFSFLVFYPVWKFDNV